MSTFSRISLTSHSSYMYIIETFYTYICIKKYFLQLQLFRSGSVPLPLKLWRLCISISVTLALQHQQMKDIFFFFPLSLHNGLPFGISVWLSFQFTLFPSPLFFTYAVQSPSTSLLMLSFCVVSAYLHTFIQKQLLKYKPDKSN